MLKTMATQLTLIFKTGSKKSNGWILIKFVLILVFLFTFFSVLFHVLMVYEGLNVFRMPLHARLENKSLIDIQIREKTGCSVVAVKKNEHLIINPDPAIVLEKGDELVLIGTADAEKMFIEKYPAASA